MQYSRKQLFPIVFLVSAFSTPPTWHCFTLLVILMSLTRCMQGEKRVSVSPGACRAETEISGVNNKDAKGPSGCFAYKVSK